MDYHLPPQVETLIEAPLEAVQGIPGPPPSDRRLYTTAPTTFLTISSEDLMGMQDAQLIEFADKGLGIVIPIGTPRTKILTRIVNSSVAVRDGV